jgi:hypothetical protein
MFLKRLLTIFMVALFFIVSNFEGGYATSVSNNLIVKDCSNIELSKKDVSISKNCKKISYYLSKSPYLGKLEVYRSDSKGSKGLLNKEVFIKKRSGFIVLDNLQPGYYRVELKSNKRLYKISNFIIFGKPVLNVINSSYNDGKLLIEFDQFNNLFTPDKIDIDLYDNENLLLENIVFDLSWSNYIFTVISKPFYKVVIKANNKYGDFIKEIIVKGDEVIKSSFEDRLIDYQEAININNGSIMLMTRAPNNSFNFIKDNNDNSRGVRYFYNCFKDGFNKLNVSTNEEGYLGGAYAGRSADRTNILTSAVLELLDNYDKSLYSNEFDNCIFEAIREQMTIIGSQLSPISRVEIKNNINLILDNNFDKEYLSKGIIYLKDGDIGSPFDMFLLIKALDDKHIALYINAIEGKNILQDDINAIYNVVK